MSSHAPPSDPRRARLRALADQEAAKALGTSGPPKEDPRRARLRALADQEAAKALGTKPAEPKAAKLGSRRAPANPAAPQSDGAGGTWEPDNHPAIARKTELSGRGGLTDVEIADVLRQEFGDEGVRRAGLDQYAGPERKGGIMQELGDIGAAFNRGVATVNTMFGNAGVAVADLLEAGPPKGATGASGRPLQGKPGTANTIRKVGEFVAGAGDAASAEIDHIPQQKFLDIRGVGDAVRFGAQSVAQMAPTSAPILAGAMINPALGGAAAYGMAVGDVSHSMKEAGVSDPSRAFAAAVPYAVLDYVTEGRIASRLLGTGAGRTVARTLAKRLAVEIPRAIATEGTTEGLQKVVTLIASELPLLDPKNIEQIVEEAAAGAFGGAALGVPGAVAPDQLAVQGPQPLRRGTIDNVMQRYEPTPLEKIEQGSPKPPAPEQVLEQVAEAAEAGVPVQVAQRRQPGEAPVVSTAPEIDTTPIISEPAAAPPEQVKPEAALTNMGETAPVSTSLPEAPAPTADNLSNNQPVLESLSQPAVEAAPAPEPEGSTVLPSEPEADVTDPAEYEAARRHVEEGNRRKFMNGVRAFREGRPRMKGEVAGPGWDWAKEQAEAEPDKVTPPTDSEPGTLGNLVVLGQGGKVLDVIDGPRPMPGAGKPAPKAAKLGKKGKQAAAPAPEPEPREMSSLEANARLNIAEANKQLTRAQEDGADAETLAQLEANVEKAQAKLARVRENPDPGAAAFESKPDPANEPEDGPTPQKAPGFDPDRKRPSDQSDAVLHRFPNKEDGVEGQVVRMNDGRFNAILGDTDADEYVPGGKIFRDEEAAIKEAKKLANIQEETAPPQDKPVAPKAPGPDATPAPKAGGGRDLFQRASPKDTQGYRILEQQSPQAIAALDRIAAITDRAELERDREKIIATIPDAVDQTSIYPAISHRLRELREEAENRPAKATFGTDNKLFTQSAADAARERLRKKLNQLNTGLDLGMMTDGVTLGGYYVEGGVREFGAWSSKMIEDLGEGFRPYLRWIYNGIRTYPGFDATGMSTDAEIDSAPEKADTEGRTETEEGKDAEQSDNRSAPVANDDRGSDAGERSEPTPRDEATRGAGRAPGRGSGKSEPGVPGDGTPDRAGEPGPGELGAASRRGDGDKGRSEPVAAPDPAKIRGQDFRLTPELLDNLGGAKTKARQNLAAIRIVKTLQEEGRLATREEQEALAKYVGWGGLADMFPKPLDYYEQRARNWEVTEDWKDDWRQLGQELKEVLSDEEYATARRSTQYAHYTSHEVIGAIYSALARLGVRGNVRALEAGAGVGNFIGLSPLSAQWTAVEMDHTSAAILGYLYPSATVHAKPYQDVVLPDGQYDVAAGNPPFGDIAIADRRYGKIGLKIHDYFFVKSLDKLRPGGVLAYVTSTGTMDKASRAARQRMADRADFLGAIRLPGTAFQKNAGTEVTTDILFFRKREQGANTNHAADWMGLAEVGDFKINEYFATHPEQILGDMAPDKLHPNRPGVYARKGDDLAALLEQAVQRLPENVYTQPGPAQKQESERSTEVPEGAKQGQYIIHKGQITQVEGDTLKPLGLDTKDGVGKRVAKLVRLGEAARAVVEANREDVSDADLKKLQKEMNKQYDAFVKEYGFINKKTTKTNKKGTVSESRPNLLRYNDPYNGPLVASLEAFSETTGTAKKTALFTERMHGVRQPIGNIDTAWKAVVASMVEYGRLDMPFMVEKYGKPETEIVAELGEKIFQNPSTGLYETPEKYLSGNVREKLALAREAAKNDSRYQTNVAALEKAQPEDVTPVQMKKMGAASVGVSWLEPAHYLQFMKQVFGMEGASLSYREADGKWSLSKGKVRSHAAYEEWSTVNVDAIELFRDMLNGQPTRVTFKVEGKVVEDKASSAAAEEKKKAIQRRFDDWVYDESEQRTDALVKLYNERMNHTVLAEWDGSHLRGRLPGMATSFRGRALELAQHQLNVVWRYLTQGNLLMAHEVGAGKTIAMITMGMEAKRMGLVRKPMYAVPNSMLGQFSRELLEIYPSAKILVADDYQFHTDRRREFLARVASDDWDAIILTQSSLKMIPTTPEFQRDIVGSILAEYQEAYIEAKKNDDKFTVKGLEAAIERYGEKLKSATEKSRQDDTVYWEDLGIDLLFVDEAHEFKNLALPTTGSVKLSDAEKTTDLYIKTRHLELVNPGRGIVFATATPVSNSIAEMYVMLRYLAEPMMKREGYGSFDAWAGNFVSSWAEQEFTAIGTLEEKHRARGYRNTYAMAQQFRSVADVKLAKDLNLPTPPIVGGGPKLVVIPGSKRLKAFMKALQARWDSRPTKPEKGDDGVFPVMNDGRFASLDARLVTSIHARFRGHDNTRPWEHSKVEYAAKNVFEVWKETKGIKGTQMVFSDLGVPSNLRKADEEQLRKDLTKEHPDFTEKEIDELIEQAMGAGGYDVYNDLADRLVAMGVPRKEIAFIQEAGGDKKKKQAIIDRMKRGEVRVLIGSTPMMGQGVNAQDRMVALHHLDVPYKPAWLQQRDGRIVRQGNLLYDNYENGEHKPLIEGVKIFRYVLQGSYDPRAWQILENKIGFITEAMTARADTGMVEEVGDSGLSAKEAYAIIKAEASDNPYAMDHAMQGGKVKSLKNEADEHRIKLSRYKGQIKSYRDRLVVVRDTLRKATQDSGRLPNPEPTGENFRITFGGKLLGTTVTDREEAGKRLLDIFEKISHDAAGNPRGQAAEHKVGEYAGMSLVAYWRPFDLGKYMLTLEGKNNYDGFPNIKNGEGSPTGVVTTLENMLERIREYPAKLQSNIEQMETDLAATEELSRAPFPRQAELEEAVKRMAELDAAMNTFKGTEEKKAKAEEKADAEEDSEDGTEERHSFGLPAVISALKGPKKPALDPNGPQVHADEFPPAMGIVEKTIMPTQVLWQRLIGSKNAKRRAIGVQVKRIVTSAQDAHLRMNRLVDRGLSLTADVKKGLSKADQEVLVNLLDTVEVEANLPAGLSPKVTEGFRKLRLYFRETWKELGENDRVMLSDASRKIVDEALKEFAGSTSEPDWDNHPANGAALLRAAGRAGISTVPTTRAEWEQLSKDLKAAKKSPNVPHFVDSPDLRRIVNMIQGRGGIMAYFPHVFGGDWVVRAGALTKRFIDRAEAIEYANDLIRKKQVTDDLTVEREGFTGDGSLYVSRAQHEKLTQELQKQLAAERAEVQDALHKAGKIKQKPRRRWFAHGQQRAVNLQTFERDLETALKVYTYRFSKKVSFDPFRKTALDAAEKLPRDGGWRDWAEQYIAEVQGVPQAWVENINNTLRNITGGRTKPFQLQRITSGWQHAMSLWHLGFSPITALINLTQIPINVIPAFEERGHYWTGVGFRAVLRGDAEANRVMEAVGIDLQHPKHLAGEFIPVNWAFGESIWSLPMWMFNKTEHVNRGTAALARYYYLRDKGVSEGEAISQARQFANRTNFDYGIAGSGSAMRNPLGRAMLQFKTFPINQTFFAQDVLANANTKQRVAFASYLVSLGGLHVLAAATPLAAVNWLLGKTGLFDDDDGERRTPYQAMVDAAEKLGVNVLTPVFKYGLMSLFGLAISERVGLGFGSARDFSTLPGGKLQLLVNLLQAQSPTERETAMKRLLPSQISRLNKMWSAMQSGEIKDGRGNVIDHDVSMNDLFGLSLGVETVDQADRSDQLDRERATIGAYRARRKDLMDRAARAFQKEDDAELDRVLDEAYEKGIRITGPQLKGVIKKRRSADELRRYRSAPRDLRPVLFGEDEEE